MNFGKLIEYNVRNILHAENDAGKLDPDLDFWLFCKKAFYKVKVGCQHFSLKIFW